MSSGEGGGQGRETLSLVPGGITSTKNCLNFSARLALPCEGGKARATASWTAPKLGAVAANLCRRSANMASIVEAFCGSICWLCTLSVRKCSISVNVSKTQALTRQNDAQILHAQLETYVVMLDPWKAQLKWARYNNAQAHLYAQKCSPMYTLGCT